MDFGRGEAIIFIMLLTQTTPNPELIFILNASHGGNFPWDYAHMTQMLAVSGELTAR